MSVLGGVWGSRPAAVAARLDCLEAYPHPGR
jgi:hypothetical protein